MLKLARQLDNNRPLPVDELGLYPIVCCSPGSFESRPSSTISFHSDARTLISTYATSPAPAMIDDIIGSAKN